MTMLFYAHSGFRYLVLAGLVLGLLYLLSGFARGAAMGKGERIVTASVLGLVHTQVLLGLLLVLFFPWYSALAGHIAMMVLAAVLGQVLATVNKKKERPSRVLGTLALLVPLILIIGGIMAIGRPLIGSGGLGG